LITIGLKMQSHHSLELLFPGLAVSEWQETSKQTKEYNCIAWAGSEDHDDVWWWPNRAAYWPEGVPLNTSVEAFIAAYRTLGYEVCDGGDPEPGLEKVALYVGDDGQVTHAARQLDSGYWTSKLGSLEDIEHELQGVEGETYGRVAQFLSRPRLF